jgi:hypothetical protein
VRLKADENIPTRVIQLLRERGQDVATVPGEDLVGAPDHSLVEAAGHPVGGKNRTTGAGPAHYCKTSSISARFAAGAASHG